MKMYSERSNELFSLAKEFSIPLRLGEHAPLSDADYLSFRLRYLDWAKFRDAALLRHLGSVKRFRVYIPYKLRVFQIAYQILWYYDEVITRDPLSVLFLDRPPQDLEGVKRTLFEVIQRLFLFRQSIESGYLLLAGPEALPLLPKGEPEAIRKIAAEPLVITALDEAVSHQMVERNDSSGVPWTLYQSRLDFGGSALGWHTSGPWNANTFAPAYKVGEEYPETTIEELSKKVSIPVERLMEKARELYPREVFGILYSAELAALRNSAILLDREAEAKILQFTKSPQPPAEKQKSLIHSFNLVLPFIDEVPPHRLIDIRADMPNAFVDFRATMTDIIQVAFRDHPEDAMDWASAEVQRRLAASTRMMESEMKSSATKLKILGTGLSAILGIGILTGQSYSLPFSWDPIAIYAGLLSAGIIGLADVVASRPKIGATDPMAFLWKATKR